MVASTRQQEDVFVGRDAELGVLRAAFADAARGGARALLIDGEAGIGKSSLVERFLSELAHVYVLRASGDESESHIRFALADQLLRGRLADGGDVLHAAQHVEVGMQLLEVFTATAGEQPSVVVVDDAHLADADSLRALLFAARRLRGAHVLLILTVRGAADGLPEGWQKLAAATRGASLTLGPLTSAHVAALGAQLGVELSPQAARRLHGHTAGSPLHARAVPRELHASGSRLHDPRPLPVPRSYGQLIRARLERCEADVVRLLEAVAILGVRAAWPAVTQLAGLDDPLAALDGR